MTLLLLVICSPAAFSSFVTQEKEKTYLRWKLSAAKKHLLVKREGRRIFLKTSNADLFSHLKSEIQSLGGYGEYIKNIEFDSSGKENGIFSIQILLKNNTELFAFYRDREKRHIVDFWKETDKVVVRKKPPVVVEVPNIVKKVKPVVQKVVATQSAKKKK